MSGGGDRPDRGLTYGLWITLAFALVEVYAGWWSGSLALLSDAGHMVTDSGALALAAMVENYCHGKPHARAHRIENMAAGFNALLMLLVLGWIVFEAVERLREPEPVKGGVVFIVAFIGLLVNGWVAHLLSRGEMIGVNRRAALLHVLSDLLGSVVALAAGLVIILTGWLAIDPLLSLLVAGLIAYATISLLRDLGGKGHHH